MTVQIGERTYTPGQYGKQRQSAGDLANRYIREWEDRRRKLRGEETGPDMPPAICFSRKIGVGALEVSDTLGEKMGYRVVEREILEHIAHEADLSKQTVALFDERYPGKMAEFLSLAFGEKAFVKSDYARHLFGTVCSLAGMAPTIFVGRGTHLLLPRDRALAVRCICSKEHRINRLARMLNVSEQEAEKAVDRVDKEQRDFFKYVYDKKDASPYEFDIIINFDYINRPEAAAEVVALAFRAKFGTPV